MARFNVYKFEKKRRVSIWVAIVPWTELPDDYFQEHCGRKDNEPFTQFSEDFGFDFFDHDSVDTNGSEVARPIADLLGECSYSSSYVAEAVAQAREFGLETTSYVFLLYDIDYKAKLTKVSKSRYMQFLGSFQYDPKAKSAKPRAS